MTNRTNTAAVLASVALAAAALSAGAGCRVTSHPVAPAELGRAASSDAMIAVLDRPGPVEIETVVAADWSIDRSGLINLEHPEAQAHGLEDGDEPIHVAFHALRHPTKGLFIVDTGVERALHAAPDEAALGGFVGGQMGVERMTIHVDTATWLARQPEPLAGVLLTHLHLDHVAGMRDVPADVPVYVGPGEASARGFMNLFTQGATDDALEGKAPLRELAFPRDPAGRFEGVLDVLGDGSVWALLVPGHTDGSTAFLVRTPEGPVLLVGDACHTAWGWDHAVEPGTFSSDGPRSADSLARLRRLVTEHPSIEVRLGHQPRAHAQATGARARTTASR
jgi:glyoxylase-like metal-dependent hydrolase (beta-lactamase superfamily II)